MENISERLVGDYLRVILGCNFVNFNVYTTGTQGEIDVVGINTLENQVYICEVATHLKTGLCYVNKKTNKTDNVAVFLKKFGKNVDYIKTHFAGYEPIFMLWSPIVKTSREGSINNQLRDIDEIKRAMLELYGVQLRVVCNQEYKNRIDQLKSYAAKQDPALTSPVLRLFQIEAKLEQHLSRLERTNCKKREKPSP